MLVNIPYIEHMGMGAHVIITTLQLTNVAMEIHGYNSVQKWSRFMVEFPYAYWRV